ncbi:MAG: hypothetical protein WBF43_10345 [Methylocella sp.]
MARHAASVESGEKYTRLFSKRGQARLPFPLSHVRTAPHSIRDLVRVQAVDKNSGVTRDLMQSIPSPRQWNETTGNGLGQGRANAFKQAPQYKSARVRVKPTRLLAVHKARQNDSGRFAGGLYDRAKSLFRAAADDVTISFVREFGLCECFN